MNDLISWLRQQLDTDEAAINRHPDGEDDGLSGYDAQEETNYPCFPYLRIDKATALRQVAAQRSILNLCAAAMAAGEVKPGTTWNDDAAGAEVAEATIRLLGEVYADRPGYREEWRP